MHGMENVGRGEGVENLILSGVDPCTSKDTLQRRPFWSNLCCCIAFSVFSVSAILSLSLSLC
jgi:hypothetical protein